MAPPPVQTVATRKATRDRHRNLNEAIGFKPSRASLPTSLSTALLDVARLYRHIATEAGGDGLSALVAELERAIYGVLVDQAARSPAPRAMPRRLERCLAALEHRPAPAGVPLAAAPASKPRPAASDRRRPAESGRTQDAPRPVRAAPGPLRAKGEGDTVHRPDVPPVATSKAEPAPPRPAPAETAAPNEFYDALMGRMKLD